MVYDAMRSKARVFGGILTYPRPKPLFLSPLSNGLKLISNLQSQESFKENYVGKIRLLAEVSGLCPNKILHPSLKKRKTHGEHLELQQ